MHSMILKLETVMLLRLPNVCCEDFIPFTIFCWWCISATQIATSSMLLSWFCSVGNQLLINTRQWNINSIELNVLRHQRMYLFNNIFFLPLVINFLFFFINFWPALQFLWPNIILLIPLGNCFESSLCR